MGIVTTSGDDVVVATKAGASVEAPKSSVTVMRSPAEEAAYEKTLHPGLLEGWAGGLNLGFALTAGNSETENLNIGFNGTRTGLHDKLILYETSIYATTSKLALQPIPKQTTANSNGGGIRYDRDFAPRVFGFGVVTFSVIHCKVSISATFSEAVLASTRSRLQTPLWICWPALTTRTKASRI